MTAGGSATSRSGGATARPRPATASLALVAAAALAASAITHAAGGATGGDARPTVVAVGEAPGTVATGFTIAPGRVVTVAHVVDGGTVTVRGPDGIRRRGTVVRRDDGLDLALLAVPGLRTAPAPMGLGARVLVRRDGGVAALPARVTRRITARVRQAGAAGAALRPALELAVPATSGDSGAPVISAGRVAGIVFARSRTRPGVAYAVDAAVLDRLVP
jgi:hypothetical protein